jgi:hypothetical protein
VKSKVHIVTVLEVTGGEYRYLVSYLCVKWGRWSTSRPEHFTPGTHFTGRLTYCF